MKPTKESKIMGFAELKELKQKVADCEARGDNNSWPTSVVSSLITEIERLREELYQERRAKPRFFGA